MATFEGDDWKPWSQSSGYGLAPFGGHRRTENLFSSNKPNYSGQPDPSIQNAYAAMTRDQWASYTNTFVPLENKLIDFAMSSTAAPDAMREASQGVDTAYASQAASDDRRLRGQGVTLDADQQMARTRATGFSKALADVHAQSTARDLVLNRQQSLLGNPAPNFGTTGKGM